MPEIAYFCSHCNDTNREIFSKAEAIEHEKTCIWNTDNKYCLSCELLGTVEYMCENQDRKGEFFKNTRRGCTAGHPDWIFNCPFHSPYPDE